MPLQWRDHLSPNGKLQSSWLKASTFRIIFGTMGWHHQWVRWVSKRTAPPHQYCNLVGQASNSLCRKICPTPTPTQPLQLQLHLHLSFCFDCTDTFAFGDTDTYANAWHNITSHGAGAYRARPYRRVGRTLHEPVTIRSGEQYGPLAVVPTASSPLHTATPSRAPATATNS